MSSGINLLGRQWPTSASQACSNIRQNMCNGWKGARCVTSALLGMAAVALTSTCSTCVAGNEEVAVGNVEVTSSPFDFKLLNTAAKVCFSGGCVYGACSVVKFVAAVVNKGVASCKVKRQSLQLDVNGEVNNRLMEEMSINCLSEAAAGAVGGGYGALIMAKNVHALRGYWDVANGCIGGVSSGLYVLDAALAFSDLLCLDVNESDMREEEVHVELEEVCVELEEVRGELEEARGELEEARGELEEVHGRLKAERFYGRVSHPRLETEC